ncbi:unnamed protein product [Durusdinium trenchii]|uniref:Uncharacterized protein n=1 Tax=Durusdinium trenchii TaxID=1381693 RepID=A0ABP0QLE3_9DINO
MGSAGSVPNRKTVLGAVSAPSTPELSVTDLSKLALGNRNDLISEAMRVEPALPFQAQRIDAYDGDEWERRFGHLHFSAHSEGEVEEDIPKAILKASDSEKYDPVVGAALEEAVAHHMANHKQTLETHEKHIKEQLGHERTARDRHIEHVEAVLRQEKEARDQHHEHHSATLQKETASREASHQSFHDAISKERALREQHHGHVQELIGKERAARQQIEDLLSRETAERHKHHETQSELVDSLQRTVGIFDALIRKDMEERKLEMKRVWEAIDGHTHDMSCKIKALGSDEEVEDETRLRPPRLATRSSPSLPGVVSPARSGGNSPKLVYRSSVVPVTQARVLSYPTTVVQAPPLSAPPVTAPPMTYSSTWSEPPTASAAGVAGRSASPSRRGDHSEVVCGRARYNGDKAHNAEIH